MQFFDQGRDGALNWELIWETKQTVLTELRRYLLVRRKLNE